VPNGSFFPTHQSESAEFLIAGHLWKNIQAQQSDRKSCDHFFGTTWCPACRAEIPQFKELFDQYASRGLKCIYIDINESASKVARFARENSFPYIVLVDPNGSVAEDYDIIGVPTITLIDKDGYLTGIAHRIRDLPIDATFLPNNR